jgi:hypothetical protein
MLTLPTLAKPAKFRLTLRGAFLLFGAAAAFTASVFSELHSFGWAGLFAAFVLLAALGEFVVADVLSEKLYPTSTANILRKLEQDLSLYYDRINHSIDGAIASLSGCDRSVVSGTFHLRVLLYSATASALEEALVQVVDYRGPYGGRRWRFLPATKGVVGRCLRTGKAESVTFATVEDYKDRMAREFGFTAREVSEHTMQARSYWAQPVRIGKEIIGVLYLFSTEPQVFPRAVNRHVFTGVANEIGAYLEGSRLME